MSVIIDFTLSLLVIFLFLSLIVSAVGEVISAIRKLRYKSLRHGINALLQGDTTRVDALFKHPLIQALGLPGQGKPSYIPAATFARALLDDVAQTARGVNDATKLVEAVNNLPEGTDIQKQLKKAMLALIADGNNTRQELEQKIAAYFDSTMERVSGWYQRQMKRILFLVALAVCAFMNADLFIMSSLLHRDANMRGQLAALGASLASSTNAPTLPDLNARLEKVSLPLGWVFPSELESKPAQPGLAPAADDPRLFPWSGSGYGWGLKKLLGFALCALAASLGAPFWFNALGKILQLRTSVRIPPPAPPNLPPPRQ